MPSVVGASIIAWSEPGEGAFWLYKKGERAILPAWVFPWLACLSDILLCFAFVMSALLRAMVALAFWLFQTACPRRIPFWSVFCLIIIDPSFLEGHSNVTILLSFSFSWLRETCFFLPVKIENIYLRIYNIS